MCTVLDRSPQNPPDGLAAGPVTEENFFEWEAAITGPEVDWVWCLLTSDFCPGNLFRGRRLHCTDLLPTGLSTQPSQNEVRISVEYLSL